MLDAAVENAETQQKKEIHKPQHNTTQHILKPKTPKLTQTRSLLRRTVNQQTSKLWRPSIAPPTMHKPPSNPVHVFLPVTTPFGLMSLLSSTPLVKVLSISSFSPIKGLPLLSTFSFSFLALFLLYNSIANANAAI
jgi:hypothetical protein